MLLLRFLHVDLFTFWLITYTLLHLRYYDLYVGGAFPFHACTPVTFTLLRYGYVGYVCCLRLFVTALLPRCLLIRYALHLRCYFLRLRCSVCICRYVDCLLHVYVRTFVARLRFTFCCVVVVVCFTRSQLHSYSYRHTALLPFGLRLLLVVAPLRLRLRTPRYVCCTTLRFTVVEFPHRWLPRCCYTVGYVCRIWLFTVTHGCGCLRLRGCLRLFTLLLIHAFALRTPLRLRVCPFYFVVVRFVGCVWLRLVGLPGYGCLVTLRYAVTFGLVTDFAVYTRLRCLCPFPVYGVVPVTDSFTFTFVVWIWITLPFYTAFVYLHVYAHTFV